MVPDIRDLGLRSPCEKVGGLVYFGRMLDKIRSHATGELPPDYQANLGKGFDGSCVRLLQVDYDELVECAKQGGMAARSEVETMFAFIDADEGRSPNANHR